MPPFFVCAPLGGLLPHETTLRKIWLPKAFKEHERDLIMRLHNQKIALVFDELTDDRDWHILLVTALHQEKSYLLEVPIFLKTVEEIDLLSPR